MLRQGPLPAGTQTTVIAAVGGAGVAAAAEFYLDHRGIVAKGAVKDIVASGAFGGATGALAANAWAYNTSGQNGPKVKSMAFNFGTAGFLGLIIYSGVRGQWDNVIRNAALGSIVGGGIGFLTDQYMSLGSTRGPSIPKRTPLRNNMLSGRK